MEFVWSTESSDYAIRESGSRIKIHKNFQEKSTLKIEYTVEGMHGGALVGERGYLGALEPPCCPGYTAGAPVHLVAQCLFAASSARTVCSHSMQGLGSQ